MKLKYLYIPTVLLALGVLIVTAFSYKSSSADEPKGNKAIIKFSHSIHKDVAECTQCHEADKSKSLKDRMMPKHPNCESCHDVENTDDCTKCHYDGEFNSLDAKKEQTLLFDHSFHMTQNVLACESCHKGIMDVDYAIEAVQPYPAMSDCYSCHNQSGKATNACEACHISTANLVPQDHKAVNFMKTHKFKAEEVNADCIMCHDNGNNSCESCHTPDQIATNNTKMYFAKPYTPNNFKDDSRQQRLTRVHDLNYRFTHGVDAQTKRFDCQSCHQTESFCVTCHNGYERDFSMSGVVPANHLKPNFFTYGVGTGGGLHADLAKRDIESCIACHDVQGADPTCLQCHMDADGIKGTNPKTHAANFMRDEEEGSWHTDAGANCYSCHSGSPSMPAGQGFCGYCHGGR